jgi:hypothetical protein
MKTLEWNPRNYLGSEMWNAWQDALEDEEWRKRDRERRREMKRKRKEERLRDLQFELENEVLRRQQTVIPITGSTDRASASGSSAVKLNNPHGGRKRTVNSNTNTNTSAIVKAKSRQQPPTTTSKPPPRPMVKERRLERLLRRPLQRRASPS